MDFVVKAVHWVKRKENEDIEYYLDLTRDLKKSVEQEEDMDTEYNRYVWNGTKL